MKYIFTGGRDYNDKYKVQIFLDRLLPQKIIVGDCPTGLDKFVTDWQINTKEIYLESCDNGYPKISVYKADWDTHGRAAGPIRNKQMLEENKNAIVIAFKGGKGTKNTVDTAKKLGMIVLEVLE